MMPCIPSSFCSRNHMVWKKMLFEEIQEFCLVHRHLCVERLKLVCFSMLPEASHQVSAQENIGVCRSCLKDSRMAV